MATARSMTPVPKHPLPLPRATHSHPLICVSPSAKFSGNIRLGGCSGEQSWSSGLGGGRLGGGAGSARLLAGVCSQLSSASHPSRPTNGRREGGRAGGRRLAPEGRGSSSTQSARLWWPRAPATPDAVPRGHGRARCPSLREVVSCVLVPRARRHQGAQCPQLLQAPTCPTQTLTRGAGRRPPGSQHPCWVKSKDPSLTGQQRPGAASWRAWAGLGWIFLLPDPARRLVRAECDLQTEARWSGQAGGGAWQKPRFRRGGPTWHWLPPPSLPIRGGGGC